MKNKILLLFACSVFITCSNAEAQLFTSNGNDSMLPKIEFGVKAGVNMQSISGDIWTQEYNAGINGGFFMRMYKNKIGGRAEVLISTAKLSSPFITDTFGNKGRFRATYIEIPLLFEYSIVPKLAITAGGQYSNLISIKNLTDIDGDLKKIFKQSEFSALIGLEGKLPYNLSIGARYRYGFSNINNEEISGNSGRWSTQAFQLFACYKIK